MKICLICHKYSVPLNDPCAFPLGFMYVSSVLKQEGYEVKVLNYNLYEYNLEEEIKGYDVAMFTGFNAFKERVIRDSKICKDVGVRTVLGGALATFCYEEMRNYVDVCYIGEYDSETDIDSIPYPDYEAFGVEEYFKRNRVRFVSILTSRGCPYSCTFCSQTCSFRKRSLDKVFEEIDFYISKYKIQFLSFNDNTLNLSKDRILRICSEMSKRSIPWVGSIRCNIFDEEIAIALSKSGCYHLVVGVESFRQEKLNMVNKNISVDKVINTLDLLSKYKVSYHGNILVGFENESFSDIREEISNIPEKYNVFPVLVQPFIGTKNGFKRNISKDEEVFLTEIFEENIKSCNMKFNLEF